MFDNFWENEFFYLNVYPNCLALLWNTDYILYMLVPLSTTGTYELNS